MYIDSLEYKVFHEIKNSITILNSTLSLLEKQHPVIASYEYWADAKHELECLCDSINKYQQGTLEDLTLERLSIHELVNSIQARLHPLVENYNFHCKVSMADNLPDLYADSFRMNSCIINIVKNSFDAMNHTGTVFMNISSEGNLVRFDIQDYGNGISKETEAKMFEPFFTTKKTGSGLGLPITKQFISEMNGLLICTSRVNDGTTFTIKIPAYNPDLHDSNPHQK